MNAICSKCEKAVNSRLQQDMTTVYVRLLRKSLDYPEGQLRRETTKLAGQIDRYLRFIESITMSDGETIRSNYQDIPDSSRGTD